MMSKLTAQGISQNRLFKAKIYLGKRRGQTRNYYNQDRYQSRYRSNSGDMYSRTSYRGRSQYGQNYRGTLQYDQNYRGEFRRGNFRGTQNDRGQNFRGGCQGNLRNDNFIRGRSRSRERQSSSNIKRNGRSRSRSRSGSRANTNTKIIIDVSSVGSMIILLKTVQICQRQKKTRQSRCNRYLT